MQDPMSDTNPKLKAEETTSGSTETTPKVPSEKKQKYEITEDLALKKAIVGFARKYKIGLTASGPKDLVLAKAKRRIKGTTSGYIGFYCSLSNYAFNLVANVNKSAVSRNVISEGQRLFYRTQANKSMVIFHPKSVNKIMSLSNLHNHIGYRYTRDLIPLNDLNDLSSILRRFSARYRGVKLKLIEIQAIMSGKDNTTGKNETIIKQRVVPRKGATNLHVLIFKDTDGEKRTYSFNCINPASAKLMASRLNDSARKRDMLEEGLALFFRSGVKSTRVHFYPDAVDLIKRLDAQFITDDVKDGKVMLENSHLPSIPTKLMRTRAVMLENSHTVMLGNSHLPSIPKKQMTTSKPLPAIPGNTPLLPGILEQGEEIPSQESMSESWVASLNQSSTSTSTERQSVGGSTGDLLDLFGGDVSVNKLSTAIGGIQIQPQMTPSSSSESFSLLDELTTSHQEHPEGKVTIDNITELTGTERCEKEGITQSGGKIHLVFTNEGYRGLAKQALFKLGYEARVTESTTQGSPKKHVLHFQGTKQELEQAIREMNAPKEEKSEDQNDDLIPGLQSRGLRWGMMRGD